MWGGRGVWAALCLRVDRGHVAQAAVKAAHREEDALLRAGGELAPRAPLQLLAQAEACDRAREGSVVRPWFLRRRRGPLGVTGPHLQHQCCYSPCGSHFADERRRSENPPGVGHLRPSSGRPLRNGSSSERCPGTLGNEGRCRAAEGEKKREARLDGLPAGSAAVVPYISPSSRNSTRVLNCDNAIFVPALTLPAC